MSAIQENHSQCCLWFNTSTFDSRQQKCTANLTMLIISITTLALAIFLSLVSLGMLKNYPLFLFGEVAIFGSGIFLTLSAVGTLISLGFLLQECRYGWRRPPDAV